MAQRINQIQNLKSKLYLDDQNAIQIKRLIKRQRRKALDYHYMSKGANMSNSDPEDHGLAWSDIENEEIERLRVVVHLTSECVSVCVVCYVCIPEYTVFCKSTIK